jgi:hypothetical protein
MGIEKGKHFSNRAVFVDYPFESVMFRCDPKTKHVYRKFYGETEDPQAIPDNNRLFNDALRFGDEITAAQYATGKPK